MPSCLVHAIACHCVFGLRLTGSESDPKAGYEFTLKKTYPESTLKKKKKTLIRSPTLLDKTDPDPMETDGFETAPPRIPPSLQFSRLDLPPKKMKYGRLIPIQTILNLAAAEKISFPPLEK